MSQQLGIHFVTHKAFSSYGWFETMSDEESMQYSNFKKGSSVVLPNDEPYTLAAIVSDTDQSLEFDIYPAVFELMKFMKEYRLDEDEDTSKEIKVLFVGWDPTNFDKEFTISLLENMVGMGFVYKLST